MPTFKVPVMYYGTFTIEADTDLEAESKAHDLDIADAELDDTDYGDAYLADNQKNIEQDEDKEDEEKEGDV